MGFIKIEKSRVKLGETFLVQFLANIIEFDWKV